MFLAGRAIAGIAVGGMVGTVPIYLSEISPAHHRGLIGGISGCGISFGTMMSNWVGFACSFAPYGPVQWRLPLGIQIPWGIVMFAGKQIDGGKGAAPHDMVVRWRLITRDAAHALPCANLPPILVIYI